MCCVRILPATDIWQLYIGFDQGIASLNIQGLLLWMPHFMRFIFSVFFIKPSEFKLIVKTNAVLWGITLKSYFALT
jgi:hypothetical protein